MVLIPQKLRLCIFLGLAVLWMTPAVFAAEKNDPARRLWMGGYEAMTKADKSMEEQATLAALHGYESALETFEKVQSTYPGWNVSLITYRIDYCRQKIDQIKKANQNNIEFMSKEEIFAQLMSQAAELQTSKDRISQLTAELDKSGQALSRARAEAASQAAAEENLQIMRKDRDALAAQVRALTAQLNASQEELRKSQVPDSRLAQVDELTKQLKRAQEELSSLGRTLEQVSATRDDLLTQLQRETQARKKDEEQMTELRRVASEARERQEEADTQVQKLQISLRSQEAESNRLQEENSRLSAERSANLAEINRLSQIAGPVEDGEGQQMDYGTLNEEYQKLETELQKLRAQLRNREEQLQSVQMDLLNAQRKLSQAEEAVTRLSNELAEERDRSAATTTAMAEQLGRVGHIGEENAELRDQASRMAQTITAQKELLASQEAAAAEQSQKIATLEEELSITRNDLAKAREELASAQDVKNRLERELRQLQSASVATEGIMLTARDAQDELDTSQKRIETLQTEISDLRARLAQSETTRQGMEEHLSSLVEERLDAAARIWKDRTEELQKELEVAQKRQMNLENALVRREQEKQVLEKALAERDGADDGNDAAGSAGTREDASSGASASAANATSSPVVLSATDQVILRGFLRQGVEAERAGKIEAAQWNYSQALAMQPENFLALKRMGLLASRSGNDGDAAWYLSLATKCNPDDTEVLLALGYSQLQLKQPEWALASLSRAAALLPRDAQTARLFGVALSTMQWREAAVVQLKKALELDEHDAEAAFNLAMIGLARSSELEYQARKDSAHREALEQLASSMRHEALTWYHQAVSNGIQEDPALEEALSR